VIFALAATSTIAAPAWAEEAVGRPAGCETAARSPGLPRLAWPALGALAVAFLRARRRNRRARRRKRRAD
jgi:hypothetical protein